MRILRIALLGLALAASAVSHAQSDALVTKRAADLRQAPGESSTSLAPLPVQTPLTRLTMRVGPWIQVKTAAGQTGWVHMFDVGTAGAQAPTSNAATGALRGLTNFFNGGSSQSRNTTAATSTVGIRGLGAEDIANAQPNVQAIAQVEGLRVDAAQAKRFAAEAPLSTRDVEPLPEPSPPARNNAPTNKNQNMEGLQ
jgi:opacity protein-like surface antigen